MSIGTAVVPDVAGFNMHFCNWWLYKIYKSVGTYFF